MVQAEGASRHPIKSGGWWSRLKLLPFTVVLCSLSALAIMCAWSNYAVKASKSTSKMLDSLAVEGGLVEWVEAYAAWVSVSIIGAIAATALAIFLGWWKLQLSSSKLLKSGPLQGKSWKRFGWVTCGELALLLLLMAFLAGFSGFCCAWLLGAAVLQDGAEYATRAFELIGQRIEALGVGALSAEEVGEVFAGVAADSVSRAATAPEAVAALQQQLLEGSGAANGTDLVAGLEQDLQDAFVHLRGAAAGLCPSSICLNLALYGFLDSERCVCSVETVEMVRRRSSSIIDDVAVALTLAVIAFTAFGVVVSKLSRDHKGVLKDWHWIREMNLKAPRSFPKDNPVNDSAQRSPQQTLEVGAPTLSAWGKPDTAPDPASDLPSAPPGQSNAWTSAW